MLMRVLGVDPGTSALGWGVLERTGTRIAHVAHGVVTPTGPELADKLVAIDAALSEVIIAHAPNAAAVEAIFYAKNAQSAAKLGHARGVVLLVLRRAGLFVGEYPPAQVKRAVVGRGRADKDQVARLVANLLRLPTVPASDAADALAVAFTHLAQQRFADALGATRPRALERAKPSPRK